MSATAELPEGQLSFRRDKREPILLIEEDVVIGFIVEHSGVTGCIAAVSIANLVL